MQTSKADARYQVPKSHGNAHETFVDNASLASANCAGFHSTDPMGLNHIHHFEDSPSIGLVEELTRIYFNRLHHGSPMLHQARYMDSLPLPPAARSPMCLRYIVLALAASISEAYKDMATPLYQRARSIADSNEMLGQGKDFLSLAHAQCWCLMSYFEARQAMFTRASISFSRSLRLAQILGLHLLDGSDQMSMETGQCTTDLIELEERRRTWWVIFICDRFICATTGWPAQIDEQDITTLLPSSEESFSMGFKENSSTLASILTEQQHEYSSFAGRVLAAHIFHRALQHTSRSLLQDQYGSDAKGASYWVQHRSLDNNLVIMMMFLPHNIKLPQSYGCQSAIFVNMMIHTATICLQRSALWKSRELMLSEASMLQYKARLLPAAQEIVNIMRNNPDIEASLQNPLILFSMYMAASVFLDEAMQDQAHESEANLDLLLHIMLRAEESNAVAGSMAAQLAAEMEQEGIRSTAMEKIKRLPHKAQPFPTLNKKDTSSLHRIRRHPKSLATGIQHILSNQANMGVDAFDTTYMDLQLQNSCIGEPGCCSRDGGELCSLLVPADGHSTTT
ncbi:binuclear zinc transcription factor [Trichoderma velutinum]